MARIDKETKLRMEGYVQALVYAKEHGLEGLELDVKRRGYFGIPIQISKREVDKFMMNISENLVQTMNTVMLWVLHTELGFGKIRLRRIKEKFDKETNKIFDFDYMGNHYVRIDDYAVYLNEKYNLGMDADRIAACQDTCRYEKDNIGMVRLETMIKVLEENGYKDAAQFLKEKAA